MKTKQKLSPETAQRINEHAKRSTDAMRRAAASGTKRRTTRMAPATFIDEVSGDIRQPAKSRRGKKAVVIYLTEEAKALFVKIAADKHTTVQDLGTLAINMMFQSVRQKPIA